jgi:hypothetical protein
MSGLIIPDKYQKPRDLEDLDLNDLSPIQATSLIAHSLATRNRFAGQTPYPYSVAQHCEVGARAMMFSGIALRYCLAFLLHELDEVFLQDIHGLLKPRLWVDDMTYRTFAARHEAPLLKALKLKIPEFAELLDSPIVKEMDQRMLMTEKLFFYPDAPEEIVWSFPETTTPLNLQAGDLYEQDWRQAKKKWVDTYRELVAKI